MPSVILLLSLLLIVGCTSGLPHRNLTDGPTLTIGAASDLLPVFTEMREDLKTRYPFEIVFSFGSSGVLTKQAEEGAPFDVLATASATYIQRIKAAGLSFSGTEMIFALGRLVLWCPYDSEKRIATLGDLSLPEVKRIAIANPEHAPYGIAAEEVLRNISIWEAVREKLVYSENVGQAFQFARTGNVDAAFISSSLVPSSGGRSIRVDSRYHAPINQTICILRRTQHTSLARTFINFLGSTTGKQILEKYGFEPLARPVP